MAHQYPMEVMAIIIPKICPVLTTSILAPKFQLLYMLPPQTESSSTATIASGASGVKREDDTNNGSNAPLAMKINM